MNQAEMISPPARPATRTGIYAGLAVMATIIGLGLFFCFNPTEYHFFPRCFFHLVSGWDCPGCGGQRALHQLLHGHLQSALRHNALFVLLLPVGGWFLFRFILRQTTGRILPSGFSHHLWPWVLCVIVIGFGVVRNLPGFDWLRP